MENAPMCETHFCREMAEVKVPWKCSDPCPHAGAVEVCEYHYHYWTHIPARHNEKNPQNPDLPPCNGLVIWGEPIALTDTSPGPEYADMLRSL